jgi:zinc transporter ZupT
MRLALLFALILALIHFLTERFAHRYKGAEERITSLSLGVFITFIFLDLVPRLYEVDTVIGQNIFLVMLWGFILFYLVEQLIYRHSRKYSLVYKELNEVDMVAFFIDHVIVGLALIVLILDVDPVASIFIFIPFLFHMLSSSLTVHQIYHKIRVKQGTRVLMSSSILLGAVIGAIIGITTAIFNILLAFLIGALLYVVIKDMLPKYRKGHPLYFVLGNILMLVILLLQRVLA